MINKILILASFFFFLGTMNSQAQTKDLDQFTVMVEGLGCPFCAYGLEKKFKELKGLKKPVIDMETGRFTFAYPTANQLTIAQVEKQVEAAGYTAVQVNIARANGDAESSEKTATIAVDKLQKEQLSVSGNCGMCRARIEKAATKIKGVETASWKEETGILTVNFDATVTSMQAIGQAIAKAGHDNALAEAKTATYDNLPACCLYRR